MIKADEQYGKMVHTTECSVSVLGLTMVHTLIVL